MSVLQYVNVSAFTAVERYKEMELHQRIVVARKKKGLTQEQVADLTNISVRTIQRIENGESVPRAYTVKAIATALDTSFEELTKDLVDDRIADTPLRANQNDGDEKHFLQLLCLSCFSYLVIPLVHFLVPIYLLKKSKIKNPGAINYSRRVIRMQIYWTVSLCFLLLLTLCYNFIAVVYRQNLPLLNYLWTFLFMYILNAVIIFISLLRLRKSGTSVAPMS